MLPSWDRTSGYSGPISVGISRRWRWAWRHGNSVESFTIFVIQMLRATIKMATEWQDPWYPGTPIDLAAARDRRVARDSARAARGGALRPWARPGILVAAAAAVIAVALTGVLLLRDTSPPQRRFDVALSTTELAPGAAVTPA
jgi:hypothetical protein